MDFGAHLRFILLFAIETASNSRGKWHDPKSQSRTLGRLLLPGQSVVFVTSRYRYWVFSAGLTLVAPFADDVEAALEERVVGRRRGSGEGEDGGGERRGGLVFGIGFGCVRWD